VPILVREGALVVEALARARELFPFPLKGVDFDNDSAFMNDVVVPWCREQGLEVTRARAYRKNDQAWVEQKNGAIVRRLSATAGSKTFSRPKRWPGSTRPAGCTAICCCRRSSCGTGPGSGRGWSSGTARRCRAREPRAPVHRQPLRFSTGKH
jgi:hypothetical protein